MGGGVCSGFSYFKKGEKIPCRLEGIVFDHGNHYIVKIAYCQVKKYLIID